MDAAGDVASLLDDVNVVIRRKAAEVLFRLRARDVLSELRRASRRDEDPEVRKWCALALCQAGDGTGDLGAEALLHDAEARWRRVAALAFARRGDARGKSELSAWWRDEGPPAPGPLDFAQSKELLEAIANVRAAEAVPFLLRSLEYVPLRPLVAQTLGQIGDVRARSPLMTALEVERYETARPFEARALASLGAGNELVAPLSLFAGLPDPMTEAIVVAHGNKLLEPRTGGASFDPPGPDATLSVRVPERVPLRLWILVAHEGGTLTGEANGQPISLGVGPGVARFVDLPDGVRGPALALALHDASGIVAVWAMPRLLERPSFLGPGDAGAAPKQ